MSVATFKRRLHGIMREWIQPPFFGEGFVHLDVTCWGSSFGVLLALDDQTGKPLYMAFVRSETVKDYEVAVSSIKGRGYSTRGLIIDGKQCLFKTFSDTPTQTCQFHMKQIVRRYFTLNPKLLAARDLRDLVGRLHRCDEADLKNDYQDWKVKWKDCKGMPNTNNKIEGTFTDLKKNLNNHSGLTTENRKRFISGFFLVSNGDEHIV